MSWKTKRTVYLFIYVQLIAACVYIPLIIGRYVYILTKDDRGYGSELHTAIFMIIGFSIMLPICLAWGFYPKQWTDNFNDPSLWKKLFQRTKKKIDLEKELPNPTFLVDIESFQHDKVHQRRTR